MSKKKAFSIKLKLLFALVASLLLASLVFYAVSQIGSFLVWRYYLGESDKRERAAEYVEDFQRYVTQNKLTTDDAEMISSWDPGRYVDLIVYRDSNLLYAPEWFEEVVNGGTQAEDTTMPAETDALDESSEAASDAVSESGENTGDSQDGDGGDLEETSAVALDGGEIVSGAESETGSETELVTDKSFYEQWFLGDRGFEQYLTEEARKNYVAALDEALGSDNVRYPVYFVDGTLIVAVVDFSEEFFSNLVFVISIAAALLVVAVIMICYFSTITKRITHLQKSVRKIEDGDLEHKIKLRGNDEIALLASDVESMRDAIVDNMTRERRAWEANAGLITAMSHDVRTPLTVLLGYLDLIEMQNEGQISEEYIASCRENAMRLKNLSDDMFSYFLVFGKSEGDIALSRIDARVLVEHLISEYTLLLSEKGYVIEVEGDVPDVAIDIEERYFRRVIDNIFSNIVKYADKDAKIVLGANFGDGTLTFYCKNRRRTDREIPESNGIGLRTCDRMMEEMGGAMSTSESDGVFTVAISFPVRERDDKSGS